MEILWRKTWEDNDSEDYVAMDEERTIARVYPNVARSDVTQWLYFLQWGAGAPSGYEASRRAAMLKVEELYRLHLEGTKSLPHD